MVRKRVVMLSSLPTELIQSAKSRLRGIDAVASANRVIKAHQLKAGLKRLQRDYAQKARERGLHHDEDEVRARVVHAMRQRHGGLPKATGALRVFWVGANRDQDESGFLQALRRLATVETFQNSHGGYGQWYWDEKGRVQVHDTAIVADNDAALLRQVREAHNTGRIDLLMGQMWANYLSKEALQAVQGMGIPVWNVSMDDRLPDNWSSSHGTRLGAVGLASATDLVLTTSAETCLWYAVEGCPAVFWPLASDPEIFSPPEGGARDIDVLFIGNKYGIRERIIQELGQRGVDVTCYGGGWPNGSATAEQCAELSKRARIILGIGTVGYCSDVFTMKLRDFDAAMAGALYITHRTPELGMIFKEGTEIECYADVDECARKIQHYLRHPLERDAVAKAGRLRAIGSHTWHRRLEDTFKAFGLLA